LNRGYQAKITTFLEELDIIQEQLKEQRDIIRKLQRGPLTERDHEYWPAFSGRYHIKLLEKCIDHLSGTRESLSELQRKAHNLEALVSMLSDLVPCPATIDSYKVEELYASQQRSTRTSYLCFHNSHHHISADIHSFQHFRNECEGRPRHEQRAMGLLGCRDTGHCYCHYWLTIWRRSDTFPQAAVISTA
jgi:hypothetical protein